MSKEQSLSSISYWSDAIVRIKTRIAERETIRNTINKEALPYLIRCLNDDYNRLQSAIEWVDWHQRLLA